MDESRMLNPRLNFDFAHNRDRVLPKILKAIEAEDGNLAATARRLGVSVDTLRRWSKRDDDVHKALAKARIQAIKEAT